MPLAPLISLLLMAEPAHVQAMAFNVDFESKQPDASLALIERAAPDLVCLEELTTAFAATFQKRLGATFPNRAFSARRDGTWGIGLASRLPIVSSEVFEQKPSKMPAVQAVVKVDDRELVVICVHLFPPGAKQHKGESLVSAMDENAKLRAEQGRAVVTRLKNEKRPVMLLGDFNEGDSGAALVALEHAGFTRAETGATWPASFPVVAIDHILVRGAQTAEPSTAAGGSDHKAVLARVELP